MKIYRFYILPFFVFLVACNGPDSTSSNENQEPHLSENDTSTVVDSVEEVLIYTAEAAIDGPDEELWIMKPGEWSGEADEEIPPYETLHVIPYEDFDSDVYTPMVEINRPHFHMWGEFGKRDADVVFWYDRNKTQKAAEFRIENGETEGLATVYDLAGDIYIQRLYEKGKWVESYHAPFASDWTFVQKDSWLYINDLENAKDPNASDHIRIMCSVQEDGPGDNYMGKILEKESFHHPFEVNDEVFTGKLSAYFSPISLGQEQAYFELNFKDGWLDGDVLIYNGWYELELHEVFVNGELDTTLYVLDYSEMDGMAKPIIYIYPERMMDVKIQLALDGHMTHSYPAYQHGWKVKAHPDGTLIDENGKSYYALYWEGENYTDFTLDEGFVVPGDQTAEFLDESLTILGLNAKERNEFIIFWLPQMEDHPYNLIHFSSDEYEQIARLSIQPEPETLIRIMMVYQPLQEAVQIPLQDLNKLAKKRKGYTVVEWGGSKYEGKLEM